MEDGGFWLNWLSRILAKLENAEMNTEAQKLGSKGQESSEEPD